jgi:hypothetical protein
MERRSGLLVQPRPRQLGRLHVRDGQVIRAGVEDLRERDRCAQQGVEAAYQMLTWPDGQFELWHAERPLPGHDDPFEDLGDEIQMRTTYLLMEGMRRLDESVHAGAHPDGAVPIDLTDEVTEVTEVSDIPGEVSPQSGRPAKPAQPANDFFVAF